MQSVTVKSSIENEPSVRANVLKRTIKPRSMAELNKSQQLKLKGSTDKQTAKSKMDQSKKHLWHSKTARLSADPNAKIHFDTAFNDSWNLSEFVVTEEVIFPTNRQNRKFDLKEVQSPKLRQTN